MNGKKLARAVVIAVFGAVFALLATPSFAQPASASPLRSVATIAATSVVEAQAADVLPSTNGIQNTTAFGLGAVATFVAVFVVLMLRGSNATERRE